MLKKYGFTLLEIIISVAIISILTTMSVPIYTQHLTNTRRMDAWVLLQKITVEFEKYYFEHGTYEGIEVEKISVTASTLKYYKIQVSHLNADSYTLTAIPIGSQAQRDIKCDSLSLNSNNIKSISGSGDIDECRESTA